MGPELMPRPASSDVAKRSGNAWVCNEYVTYESSAGACMQLESAQHVRSDSHLIDTRCTSIVHPWCLG